MRKSTRRVARWTAGLAALALLAGCNTMAGVGKDTSAAGRALTNSAADTKANITSTGNPQGCATPMHQDLPGGTDYKGPPVVGCPQQ